MGSLMDLKETDILGADIADHWYYKSKVKAMMRVIGEEMPSKILDVGANFKLYIYLWSRWYYTP